MSLPCMFMSVSSLKHNNLERVIILLLLTTEQLFIISQLCMSNDFLQPHSTHLEIESSERTGRGENVQVSSKINHELRPCHYPELREKNDGAFLYYQLLDILFDG